MLAPDVKSRPQSAERVGIGAIGERCGQEDAVLIQAVVKTLQRSKDVAAISAFESMTALAHHERNRSHFVALGGIPLVLYLTFKPPCMAREARRLSLCVRGD